jgi:penicillin-binding protein 2A
VVRRLRSISSQITYYGGSSMKTIEPADNTVKVKKVKKKSFARAFWKVTGFFVLFLFIISVIAGAWVWEKGSTIYANIDISKLDKEPPRPTIIYDVKGNVISELSNSRMEYLHYDQFPKSMVDAIVSVEDARFREHNGVDFKGMGRAFYTNLRNRSIVQGGSTITQQLAKVTLYSSEQTFTRKINEMLAAIKIEKNYSKEQILEMYLNYIYYGEGAYGLQRAAQIYFGKPAAKLTLSESAMLAGLPKAPTNYSPVDHPQRAKERRNLVLELMAVGGHITAEERDKAIAEPIKLSKKSVLAASNKYSSYVDHVLQEATDKFKLTEQEVLTSGLKIYTNLDPAVQIAAEAVYNNPKMFPQNKGGLQSSMVILDAKTGAIRGIIGGLGKSRSFRGFNYATQLERQPGSSLKPIVAYAPALMLGYKPNDLIDDVETDFNGYKPQNYGDKFHGWVTMEQALVNSYNVPAVALLKEVGIGEGLQFVKKAGIPLTDSDRNFGIALGGMEKGTSPLKMAQAYTMFANGGKMSEAYAIVKITDRDGKVLHEAKPVSHEVLYPDIAYTMTGMLQKVVTEGTGTSARMNVPVAGKTGTTQLPDLPEFKDKHGIQIDGSKDAWFVGYTPNLVAAVWLGYQNTDRKHYLTTTGGKYPAAIFKEVLSQVVNNKTATAFAVPAGYKLTNGEVKHINGTPEDLVKIASLTVVTPTPSITPTPSVTPAPSVSPDASAPTEAPVIESSSPEPNTEPEATPAPTVEDQTPAATESTAETPAPEPVSTPAPSAEPAPTPEPSPAA